MEIKWLPLKAGVKTVCGKPDSHIVFEFWLCYLFQLPNSAVKAAVLGSLPTIWKTRTVHPDFFQAFKSKPEDRRSLSLQTANQSTHK